MAESKGGGGGETSSSAFARKPSASDRSGSISRTEMSEFMESMCSVAQQYANEQVKDFSSLLGGDTPHARRAGLGSGEGGAVSAHQPHSEHSSSAPSDAHQP